MTEAPAMDIRTNHILVETLDAGRAFRQGDQEIVALLPTTSRVHAGDRVGLMGASGSGKSTLLHLMAGLDAPTTGEVRWPALGPAETLRPGKIAVVFQFPSLMAPLSVIENVELLLILSGASDNAREKATAALARLGLENLAAKLPEELSGGQAQRVAMVRAIACEPRLILTDEPTGQLDQRTGQAVMSAFLEWLSTTRTALVLATHDPTMAERMDQVWRMEHGRLTMPT